MPCSSALPHPYLVAVRIPPHGDIMAVDGVIIAHLRAAFPRHRAAIGDDYSSDHTHRPLRPLLFNPRPHHFCTLQLFFPAAGNSIDTALSLTSTRLP